MTCPNRDGKLGDRGCIFCSSGGSGEFSADKCLSITEQIEDAKRRIQSKTNCKKFIAYFQPFTNTYADVEYLRRIFHEAIAPDEIAALSIATRPDCLGDDVLALLDELNKIKPVWVELGLQTSSDKTAEIINRYTGPLLPGTGGAGVLMFYAIGLFLLIGGGMLLILCRKDRRYPAAAASPVDVELDLSDFSDFFKDLKKKK